MRERVRTLTDDMLRLVGVWALVGASVSGSALAVWSWAKGFSGLTLDMLDPNMTPPSAFGALLAPRS